MSTDRARTERGVTIPSPGETKFQVRLLNDDGADLRHFVKGGPVEVWLEASEQPLDNRGGTDGLQFVILPLGFPNYPIARTCAEGLGHALGALERAIERAQEAANTPIPTLDDGHRHVVRFARYARALPYVAMCEVCMEELVDDVMKWAGDRGLTTSGNPIAEPMNLRSAIENVVNRIGEEVTDG